TEVLRRLRPMRSRLLERVERASKREGHSRYGNRAAIPTWVSLARAGTGTRRVRAHHCVRRHCGGGRVGGAWPSSSQYFPEDSASALNLQRSSRTFSAFGPCVKNPPVPSRVTGMSLIARVWTQCYNAMVAQRASGDASLAGNRHRQTDPVTM